MEKNIFASGCYTEKSNIPNACGEGIVLLSLDDKTGRLSKLTVTEGVKNPSYLDWDRDSQTLYAITENPSGEGEVRSFFRKPDNTLVLSSLQVGPGQAGCHIKAVKQLHRIFAASYRGGSLKSYFLEEGHVGPSLCFIEYSGCGPDADRQGTPHAHQVLPGPDNAYLYVCDLGSDRVWIHDAQKSDLPIISSFIVPPGYGPRHLAFDPEGKYAFILCELVPRLLVVRLNREDGSLVLEQDLSTVGEDSTGGAAPAAVKVHPSGKTVAVSNRFDDTITIFKIQRNPGALSLKVAESFSSRGKVPRDICFSPSGRWLLMAHQDSNDVQIREINPENGLTKEYWSEPLSLGSPVCLIPLD
ncbi:lactonase family protein [Oceanispirochaeta crateris]|uniref:Lactonase family protein n=1 Tax=Oceanispirochaeta crateris TaxID=2518645 RepID=A0A5C1QSK3_9SPIO|nr:lactonase family protein [Oceanispirochaeta crateris]QEN09576.1 lactonase family protein [Oceanispirochaeta crateris]